VPSINVRIAALSDRMLLRTSTSPGPAAGRRHLHQSKVLWRRKAVRVAEQMHLPRGHWVVHLLTVNLDATVNVTRETRVRTMAESLAVSKPRPNEAAANDFWGSAWHDRWSLRLACGDADLVSSLPVLSALSECDVGKASGSKSRFQCGGIERYVRIVDVGLANPVCV